MELEDFLGRRLRLLTNIVSLDEEHEVWKWFFYLASPMKQTLASFLIRLDLITSWYFETWICTVMSKDHKSQKKKEKYTFKKWGVEEKPDFISMNKDPDLQIFVRM